MNGINGINSVALSGINGIGSNNNNKVASTDSGFKTVLDDLIKKANETDSVDKQQNFNLMTGDLNNIHDVVISGEEADLALRLTVQVRNKIVDAYTEIMRMQV